MKMVVIVRSLILTRNNGTERKSVQGESKDISGEYAELECPMHVFLCDRQSALVIART